MGHQLQCSHLSLTFNNYGLLFNILGFIQRALKITLSKSQNSPPQILKASLICSQIVKIHHFWLWFASSSSKWSCSITKIGINIEDQPIVWYRKILWKPRIKILFEELKTIIIRKMNDKKSKKTVRSLLKLYHIL